MIATLSERRDTKFNKLAMSSCEFCFCRGYKKGSLKGIMEMFLRRENFAKFKILISRKIKCFNIP
jgi:hypothetical protein